MEFKVRQLHPDLDLATLRQLLCDADASAIVDFDPLQAGLRVSAQLGVAELAGLLKKAGLPVALEAIEPQPSTCCGGCGG